MAKAFSEWTVLPHEPLQKLSENLWWVRGSLPGMSLKRVMTVAKRSDGGLVLNSPIALEESAMREIEAFGPPAFIVVPNGAHRLDAPAYKRRYPGARVLAPRGARAKVEQVLRVDGSLEDFPADEAVRFETLHGVKESEGVMLVRSADGVTLVFCDAIFNMDRKRDPLGFLFTAVLGSAPGPRVSRLAKLLFIQDRRAFRGDLERLAELPELTRVVVAHEKVASGADARAALLRAAQFV